MYVYIDMSEWCTVCALSLWGSDNLQPQSSCAVKAERTHVKTEHRWQLFTRGLLSGTTTLSLAFYLFSLSNTHTHTLMDAGCSHRFALWKCNLRSTSCRGAHADILCGWPKSQTEHSDSCQLRLCLPRDVLRDGNTVLMIKRRVLL